MRTPTILLLSTLAVASPALGGLRFRPVDYPQGLEANALSGESGTLFVATNKGIFVGSGTDLYREGLGELRVTSVAATSNGIYAAADGILWRRSVEGVWLNELGFPSEVSVNIVVASGSSIYAGGAGLARRDGPSWIVLPRPPGTVQALGLHGNELYAGFSFGGLVRLTGGSWTASGPPELGTTGVRALLSEGGNLWVATDRGLYTGPSSATLVRDNSLPATDIRALLVTNGTVFVATSIGPFRRAGSSWVHETAGLTTVNTSSLTSLQGNVFLGTRGGPVFRRTSNGVWVATTSLGGATISALVSGWNPSDTTKENVAVGTPGAGVTLYNIAHATRMALPDGCGDIEDLALSRPLVGNLLAATSCGVFLGGSSAVTKLDLGLPPGSHIRRLGTFNDSGVFAGTDSHGIFRLDGIQWVADSPSFLAQSEVSQLALSNQGGFAVASGIVYERLDAGAWVPAGPGLPPFSVPLSITALDDLFVGLAGGGVYRRVNGTFRRDSFGLLSESPLSLTGAGGRLIAATGSSSVLAHNGAGFVRESNGLPAGSSVQFIRPDYSGAGLWAGTSGHGLFHADVAPNAKTLPVVIDAIGATGARFQTELVLGNPTGTLATVRLTFVPAEGFGRGPASRGSIVFPLEPHTEFFTDDVFRLLRTNGLSLPQATPTSPLGGTLTLEAAQLGDPIQQIYLLARTYTRDTDGGTFGLFYEAVANTDAPEESAIVFGLRRGALGAARPTRANLAVAYPIGTGQAGPLSLQVRVYTSVGGDAPIMLAKDLQPGDWFQWNDILGQVGLPANSEGYAVVTRLAGQSSWIAYGVLNDEQTSDGTFLLGQRPGGLSAARKVVIPVVLDVFGASASHYTSEVVLGNYSSLGTPVDFYYRPAPNFGSAPGVPFVSVSLPPRSQVVIPDALSFLRANGVDIPLGTSVEPQAGSLSIEYRFHQNLDSPITVAFSRISTPSPMGGAYGVALYALARGGGARSSAVVPALQQTSHRRSNLAIAHLGGGSELPLTLKVQLFDSATGLAVGTALTHELLPGEWFQWSQVLRAAGVESVERAWALVSRMDGDDSWAAYGVVNDQITSDGSTVPMVAISSGP